MSSSGTSSKSLGFIGILCGFLCESAAALPFVAPEVVWVSAEHSIWMHLAAALLGGGGAAALFAVRRGFVQWVGPTLFFALLILILPGAGLPAVLILSVILLSHHAQVSEELVAHVAVPERRRCAQPPSSKFGPGPVNEPLVGAVNSLDSNELRSVVLGMKELPPVGTRPILKKLQRHPDLRVQLYANGMLNDQIDGIERRLATLKKRVADTPGDEESQIAVIETYLTMFEHQLVAADEEAQVAAQALQETNAALVVNPSNATALRAKIEFHMLRGELSEAEIGIEQLRYLPGQAGHAQALNAQHRFELAALQDLPSGPDPNSSSDSQSRTAPY